MKKATLTIAAILIFQLSVVAQGLREDWAKRILKSECPKIEYVFEGEIVKIDLYAAERDGTRLTGKDILWDKASGGYTYRHLKDGGSASYFSIAYIKVCQVYKGFDKIDTVKIVTVQDGWDYSIKINGTDTSVVAQYMILSSNCGGFGEQFFHAGMKGFNAIFFGYNHSYAGVSNQIKTISNMGAIVMHTKLYNPDPNFPYNLVFASPDGPLCVIHPVFFSRREVNRFLRHLPIHKLRIHRPNLCIAAKEKTTNWRRNKREYRRRLKRNQLA